MTEEQERLSMGVSFLVQASRFPNSHCSLTTSYNESHRSDHADNTDSVRVTVRVPHPYGTESPELPPLSPLQTLALSVLIDPSQASTSALIDALKEAGVITEEWEGLVRADERERAAKVCDDAASQWHQTAATLRQFQDGTDEEIAARATAALLIAAAIRARV